MFHLTSEKVQRNRININLKRTYGGECNYVYAEASHNAGNIGNNTVSYKRYKHHAPGNYGLLDMALAIKWVYDNADAFQGDRNKITLFGPDAGAAAAGILAVMPKTRSMIRRVIAISGSPLADWAVFNDKFRAMNVSRVYGERIGCTVDQFSSWELVDCIKTGKQFHELSNIEFKPEIGTWPWAPVVQKNISVPEDGFQVEWKSDDFMGMTS